MPFETPNLAQLIDRTQNDLGRVPLRRADAQVLARAISGAAYGLYGYMDWIAEQILPDSADEDTLERMATLRLKQPRKAAQRATGRVAFNAIAGARLEPDTLLQSDDGRSYRVSETPVLVAGVNQVAVEALDPGTVGNAEAGLALFSVQPVAGVGGPFTVLAPGVRGGVAVESLEALRARVIRSYRVIPHGGSADDYVTWALEFPGVTRAWCRRNYLGPGTVGVFVMCDEDAEPLPDASQLAAVKAYIEPLRPVTAEVHVLAPTPIAVTYRLRLTPDSSAVRAAVEAQLADLHKREAELGEPLLLSHIREAISGASGERDHRLDWPSSDVSAQLNQLLVYGGCQWLD
ncbi:baseplate J/gp47 family protein [Pseudomonas mosselii]|uniref:baseplate J/gp47 family protein n=1 Tax=Pseudomonas mosselii TaxID=78327 RepID=UPI001F4C4C21|nr:baseplate J/gp47 family protein [Pseudomonas mosselii]MCH7418542.1 baseplate J/gp47 family protein [Pseudomonas mosselii]